MRFPSHLFFLPPRRRSPHIMTNSPPTVLTFEDFRHPNRRNDREARNFANLDLSRTSTLTNNTPDHSRSNSTTRGGTLSRTSSMDRSKQRLNSISTLTHTARYTHRFLSQELAVSYMGAPVLICFFTSGLIDSVAFNSWNCFVGMQTGTSGHLHSLGGGSC